MESTKATSLLMYPETSTLGSKRKDGTYVWKVSHGLGDFCSHRRYIFWLTFTAWRVWNFRRSACNHALQGLQE